jgi:hypothetical protein
MKVDGASRHIHGGILNDRLVNDQLVLVWIYGDPWTVRKKRGHVQPASLRPSFRRKRKLVEFGEILLNYPLSLLI